ncbi:MAG: DUF1816 domain-containing protein [Cyanobacteria bacterium P01_D01_bin.44]
MKSPLDKSESVFTKAWWLEILTAAPHCIYYFGPFESEGEAARARAGYRVDLEQEGAVVRQTSVMWRTTPAQLTVEYPINATYGLM